MWAWRAGCEHWRWVNVSCKRFGILLWTGCWSLYRKTTTMKAAMIGVCGKTNSSSMTLLSLNGSLTREAERQPRQTGSEGLKSTKLLNLLIYLPDKWCNWKNVDSAFIMLFLVLYFYFSSSLFKIKPLLDTIRYFHCSKSKRLARSIMCYHFGVL